MHDDAAIPRRSRIVAPHPYSFHSAIPSRRIPTPWPGAPKVCVRDRLQPTMARSRWLVATRTGRFVEGRTVSVIIASQGSADLLPMALAHLEVQTYPAAQFEILVADYGEGKDTADVLERYSAGAPVRTRCLRLPGSNLARARNLAAREAEGHWLLFLDAELLAGSSLVEAHVKSLVTHGDASAVSGTIRLHPQVDELTFTKIFDLCPYAIDLPGERSPAAAWGFYNLSLSRTAFLDAGGFDESLSYDGLQELALGWTLTQRGMTLDPSHDAAAYAWRPIRLEDERRRQYLHGYSLPAIVESSGCRELLACFPVKPRPFEAWADRLLLPMYRRVCRSMTETRRPGTFVCHRILRHDFHRGYRDALARRPPAPG